jgi:hypothetical protein
MDASGQLRSLAETVKPAVLTACAGIASDLHARDTWSSFGDADDAIANSHGTGACDAARGRIVDIMQANATANFALAITRGVCVPDFKTESNCEAVCEANEKCDPGTVETRCDPAQLSVMCTGSCSANAFCEGTPDVPANCQGACEAECTGSCSGTCTDESGHRTEGDPNCHGKCASHCNGVCKGRCKVDTDGVQCGTNVFCKAGCTSSFTSPRCESEFTPPHCTIDEACFEHCRASAVAHAVCSPPTVSLLADASVSADVAALVDTVGKHLPPLIQIAEAQGPAAVDIVTKVTASGEAVLKASATLDGKSIACGTAAASELSRTAGTLNVSVQAGSQVVQDCSSHAQ